MNSEQQSLESRRNRLDAKMAAKRLRVDNAISEEILPNPNLVALIKVEREHTDRQRDEERSSTDTAAKKYFDRLTREVQLHLKTRADLLSRDEFLAIVSHDLKNPIGAVSACGEMLLKDSFYSEIDEKIKPWITFMKRNADSALVLIRDLLDLERIEGGKLTLNKRECEIGQLLRDVAESFVFSATARKILLRVYPTVMNCKIVCDHDRILQVVSNLIENALKFTPDGGTVVVKMASNKEKCTISVADTGPGIPVERQNQIFDRFAQLDTADRRGLGLGLYVSRMIVEAHEGHLWVNGTPTEGSTFSFTLPHVQA